MEAEGLAAGCASDFWSNAILVLALLLSGSLIGSIASHIGVRVLGVVCDRALLSNWIQRARGDDGPGSSSCCAGTLRIMSLIHSCVHILLAACGACSLAYLSHGLSSAFRRHSLILTLFVLFEVRVGGRLCRWGPR